MTQIPTDYRALKGSERKPRTGARRTGSENPNETLTVSIRIRRRPDAPPLPDLTGPGRRRLSRKDFAALYGASQDDLAAIAAFSAANGLSVIHSSIPRRTVVVKGTVAQMNRAFAVDLGRYETADEKYRGREGPVHVPTAIADIVEGVFGLDNRKMARRHIGLNPSSDCAPGTAALTPPFVAQLYGFPTSPATGQTIALLEFGAYYNSSAVKNIFKRYGMTPPPIVSVSVEGAHGGIDPGEISLDIAVAGSVATGARLAIYVAEGTQEGWVDAVTTAVHDEAHSPSVISISYGYAENEKNNEGFTFTLSAIQAINATFQEAAVLGVTIFASSGDEGSDCGIGDKKAHVEYPGSDPYVTCCGGTSISNVEGSEFIEKVWEGTGRGGTGGGISDIFYPPHFPLQPWQSFARLPGSVNDGHNGRGVPDIAGNADGCSGYWTVSEEYPDGGTSASTPLYAALAALLNANLGEPIGYLNPFLYAGPDYIFRDISDGLSNARSNAPGYTSGPGWDGCTGLGCVNGIALKYALQGGGSDALLPLLLSGS
jgi:kumamolisin